MNGLPSSEVARPSRPSRLTISLLSASLYADWPRIALIWLCSASTSRPGVPVGRIECPRALEEILDVEGCEPHA
jgi:hypothetical protein